MRAPITDALPFERDGNVATFSLATDDPLKPLLVKVAVVGDEFEFFPERSSGHRKIMALLGLTQP